MKPIPENLNPKINDLIAKFIERYWIDQEGVQTVDQSYLKHRTVKRKPYLVVEYTWLSPADRWEYKVVRIDPQPLDVYTPNSSVPKANLIGDDYIFFNSGVRNIDDQIFKNKYPDYIFKKYEKWSKYGLGIWS